LRKLNSIYQIWFNNCASIPGIWKQNFVYMWGWALKLRFAGPHPRMLRCFVMLTLWWLRWALGLHPPPNYAA
jgi:hypothetical protein